MASILALATPAATPAFADNRVLGADAVSSPTNPGAIDDYNVVWREGWGNQPLARFQIQIPGPSEGQAAIVGAVYTLMRPHAGMIDTLTADMWPTLYNAPVSQSSKWDLAVDMIGEDANPGPYFGPQIMVPGAKQTYEGPFVGLFRFFAKDEPEAAGGGFAFGLDVTPPAKVTGLRAVPGYGNSVFNGFLKQSRVHLFWDDKLYDTLAGTGYFEAFLDGKPYPLSSENAEVSRKVYDLQEHFPGYGLPVHTPREMTIEDLPAGKHVLQIRAVDRATNEGPLSDPITVSVDPDIPAVDMVWPAVNGQVIGASPTVKANVVDLGGVKAVRFYVDGAYKATDTAAPYQATLDLSGYANGSTHKITVIAEDMAGRQSPPIDQNVVVDKYGPKLSSVSGGYNPFYPRKQDGYRDSYKVKFSSSEAATATLTIKDSSGKTWRTMTKAVSAGASSFTWNGKSTSGDMKEGTFRWYLKLTDRAGNVSSTSGSTRLRYYVVVQTSRNTVKLVAH